MIKINNLTKTYNYKKSNAFEALKNISISINDGELISIVGSSGSGKTTLLNIIGCIDKAEQGECIINDVNITKLNENKRTDFRADNIGFVVQDFALIENYSVLENILIPTYFSKNKIVRPKDKANDLLKTLKLEQMKNKDVSTLSGGQKQRVAIARAIINDPSIILADEPTGALDTKTSGEIMLLFKELNKKGKTVIIVTHDPKIAKQCDRVIHISDGKVINL